MNHINHIKQHGFKKVKPYRICSRTYNHPSMVDSSSFSKLKPSMVYRPLEDEFIREYFSKHLVKITSTKEVDGRYYSDLVDDIKHTCKWNQFEFKFSTGEMIILILTKSGNITIIFTDELLSFYSIEEFSFCISLSQLIKKVIGDRYFRDYEIDRLMKKH